MTDIKVKIDLSGLKGIDREIVSTRIQDICFAMGIFWISGRKEAQCLQEKYIFIDTHMHNCTGSKIRFEEYNATEIGHQDFIAKFGKPLKIQPAVIDMKDQPSEVWDEVLDICVRGGFDIGILAKTHNAAFLYIEDSNVAGCKYGWTTGDPEKVAPQEFISMYSPVKEPAKPQEIELNFDLGDANKTMIDNDLIRVEDKKPEPIEEDEVDENGTIIIWADRTFGYSDRPTKFL